MRLLTALLVVTSVALVPQLARADDAGVDDAGSDSGPDAAIDDAGIDDAGSVPDATAGDDTGEHCLDGYDRSYVAACSGLQSGAVCTFDDGQQGQCAALRCLDDAGAPLQICTATSGMAAPPPSFDDAGSDDDSTSDDTSAKKDDGGCSTMPGSGVGGGAGLLLAVALWARRARVRS